jgi:hypothetical protein
MKGWFPLLCVSASALFPTPPLQTESQRRLYKEQAHKAKQASHQATHKLLNFFQTKEFRGELQACCPEMAELSSPELLRRIRAEFRAAELAHAFPSVIPVDDHFHDVTVEELSRLDFFPNQWQVPLMRGGTEFPVNFNVAEEGIFGMAPFKNDSSPTWTEAADRLVYVALNQRQIDHGSLTSFGEVGAIFSHSAARDMVLIAPVDTGAYGMTCNVSNFTVNSSHHFSMWNFACDEYWQPQTVGTLDHFDHIIYASFGLWTAANTTLAQEAGAFLRRSSFAGKYVDLPETNTSDAFKYPESNIVGNPRFPDGLSLLIGGFAELFGSDQGRELQRLADNFSLPLAWSLGTGGVSSDHHHPWHNHSHNDSHNDSHNGSFPHHFNNTAIPFPGNQRILDPRVSREVLNVTVPSNAEAQFEALWTTVSDARVHGNGTLNSTQVKSWWSSFVVLQKRIAPLTATSCAASDDVCFGVDALSGDCLCRIEKRKAVVVV